MDPLRTLRPLRQGDSPLHRQAESALRRLADRPDFANGALFPDELSLAKRLGISRSTVRTALSALVRQGRIERKAGVGTRVVKRAVESAVTAWRSLSEEMDRRGIKVELFRLSLDARPAPPNVAAALRIAANSQTLCLDRVRGWNGTPVLLSRSWFHPRVRFREGESFTRPLYDLIAQTSGLSAARACEEFGAEAAGKDLAKDLAVERGAPLLLRRHTVFDEADRPIEYAEVHYVSGRFLLTLDLHRRVR